MRKLFCGAVYRANSPRLKPRRKQVRVGAAATTLTVIRAGSLIDGTGDAARKNQLIFCGAASVSKKSRMLPPQFPPNAQSD